MKILALALLALALTSCASLPSPGKWNANRTQYADTHTIDLGIYRCDSGLCAQQRICAGEIDGPKPQPAQCDHWRLQSHVIGVTDSHEAPMIWANLVAGEFHAFSPGSCPDRAALGPFLPVWAKAAIGGVPAFILWRHAKKTPLDSSVAIAGWPSLIFNGGMGWHNRAVSCGR